MLCRPVVLIMVLAVTVLSTEQRESAQDCLLYHLSNTTTHQAPTAHLHYPHLLTLSLWVGEEGGWPNRFSVQLQPDNVNIYFNEDGSATVRINGELKGGPEPLDQPSPPAHSWLTLSLTIRDHTLIIYRPEQPYRTLAVPYSPSAGQQVAASVSTSMEMHVAFNCETVCIIHDANSPLVGIPDLLHPNLTLYLRPESPEGPQYLTLHPSNTHGTLKDHNFNGRPGVWSKVQAITNRESAGGEGVLVVLPNQTFTITAVQNLLWTLYCHPGDPEEWIVTTDSPEVTLKPQTTDRNSSGTDTTKSPEEVGGADAGEVAAWVLAGLALAGVVVLALALCTKMAPKDNTPTDDNGYNLASVGYLSHRFDGGREAEEGSEPATPVQTSAPGKDIY